MSLKRFFLCLALCVSASSAAGASMADRSPFFQGHWWDPSRSGHGFEIFNAADQVMAVWYTYDTAAKPIWYTAQGPRAELGVKAWPLQAHRWSGGRISQSTTVGELRLVVKHTEQIAAEWYFPGSSGGNRGTAMLRPYLASTLINEVDHTGHWFDPTQSGWGFTLTEQGDTLGSVLYAYDASGAPTWIAGFGRRRGPVVDFFATTGTCAQCAYAPISTRPVGSVRFEYAGESELTIRSSLDVAFAPSVTFNNARARQLGRPASTRAADRQLAAFADEASLNAFIDAGMLNMPPSSGGIDFSAAPPSTRYSPTNLQEEDVDEAALVKTDGRYVYTYAFDNMSVVPAVRVGEVGGDGASFAVKGSVPLLGAHAGDQMLYTGLVHHGNRLVSITGTAPSSSSGPPWLQPSVWMQGVTQIEVMDTSAELPTTLWRVKVDGHVIATRRIGDRLFVVSRFAPQVDGFQYGAYADPYLSANRQLLAATPLAAKLPRMSINGAAPQPALDARSVYAPPLGGRTPLADMILVVAVDLAQPQLAQVVAVAGTADAVYASAHSLYLAHGRENLRDTHGNVLPYEAPVFLTDVHRIDLSGSAMRVAGTGTVEGYLDVDPDRAQFRMSEHEGRLRIVTNSTLMWSTRNRLTILEPSTVAPGLLKTLAWLPNETRPQPLGKENERIFATRFAGDRLYAVTFRQVDPLYVVDLSQPADPQITGLVEVPGFATYLHPLPTGQLLGFGRDATAWGAATGLQLSLYNITGSGAPVEVQRFSLGKAGSSSALEGNHQALSVLARSDGTSTIAFPARITEGMLGAYGYPWYFSGLLRFDLAWATPTEQRLVPQTSLVSHHKSTSNENFADPAPYNARSVLFPSGTLYIGYGKFWHQDGAGSTVGPL